MTPFILLLTELKGLLEHKEFLMDIVNKVSKIIDHNRGLAGGFLALAVAIYIPSCAAWDGEVVSTTTGEVVNAEQREAEYVELKKASNERLRELDATIRALVTESENLASLSGELDEEFVSDMDDIQAELDARKEGVLRIVNAVTQQAPGLSWILPWVGIGTTAVAGGAVYDNRRKDKIIKKAHGPPVPS